MTPIDFFKLQSKNLIRDFKTQTTQFDAESGNDFYEYAPKYFDVLGLILDDYITDDECAACHRPFGWILQMGRHD